MHSWCVSEEDQRRLHQLIALADEGLGYAIYKHIEHVKKQLSTQEIAQFQFHHPAGISIEENLSQKEFFEFSHSITDRIISTLNDVLNQAQVKPNEIDLVCLTGGTAQMKSIKTAFENMFGEEKIKQFRFFHSIINGLAEKAKETVQE
jgi:hypothetical chaperone protein